MYLPQWIKLSSCGCCWSLIRVNTRFLFWSASVPLTRKHCRTASLSLLSSSSRNRLDFSSFRFEEFCISRFNTCDLPRYWYGWRNCSILCRCFFRHLNLQRCVNLITSSPVQSLCGRFGLKESDTTSSGDSSVSAMTSPETSSSSYLDHHSWFSQALVWFAVPRCRSLVLFF